MKEESGTYGVSRRLGWGWTGSRALIFLEGDDGLGSDVAGPALNMGRGTATTPQTCSESGGYFYNFCAADA